MINILLIFILLSGVMALLGEIVFCIRKGFFSGALLFSCFSFVFLNLWTIIALITNEWSFGVSEDVVFVISVFNLALLFSFLLRWFSILSPRIRSCYIGYGSSQWVPLASAWALCLLVVIYFFYSNGVPMLSGDVDMARHLSRKSGGFINMFVNRGIPLFSLALIGAAYLNKRIGLVYLIFFICIVIQFMTAFRADVAFFVIVIFMYWCFVNRSFNLSVLGKSFLLCVFVFVFVTFLKYDSEFVQQGYLFSTYKYIEHRIILELPRVISYCLELVQQEGFLYGKTYLMDIATVKPGPDIGFGDYLMIFRAADSELAGLAPLTPSLVGESFSNYGYIGVFLSPVLVLFLYKYLDSSCTFSTVFGIAVRISLSFFVANSLMLGLGGIIVPRIIPLVFFSVIFYFLYLVFRFAGDRREAR